MHVDPKRDAADVVLECHDVHQAFGPTRVIFDVNFQMLRGGLVSLVGPSGCGKTTLLRAILGTHPPSQGRILVCSGQENLRVEVNGPGRERGIVYQRYALFPFLTAQQNVALGLSFGKSNIVTRWVFYGWWRNLRKAHMEEAAEMLGRLGLKDALQRYPHQLSGGMCQRVAIAQALIMKPEILLMDEPFGALDNSTREDLQRLLLRLYWESRGAKEKGQKPLYTFLLVTHELNEAIYVADRVLGLSQYWNWPEAGHAACPGATIVYDAPAPLYTPEDEPTYADFKEQREEIIQAVFNTDLSTQPVGRRASPYHHSTEVPLP